jgi:hypothetical protein
MDWFLGFGAMAHIGMMTKKWPYAGYFGLLMQIGWVLFAISTGATGLLVSCVGFTIMHCNTIWQWHFRGFLISKGLLEDLKEIPAIEEYDSVDELREDVIEKAKHMKPVPPERPKMRKITESFGCVIHDTSMED